jgi:multidrug efflux pump subunit AcrB
MKRVFNFITSLSLRFRAITLIIVLVISFVGVVAATQLNQELIPPIEIPQTFILAQVSGMSSEQVLKVVTERIEAEIDQIPEIINIESTTTSAIGAFVTASNDFGLDQLELKDKIQEAIDQVWLPQRFIQSDDSENPQAFSARLLGDLTPEVLIYIAEQDSNFLFQLAPETWATFSDDTVHTVLAYLANQVAETQGEQTPLERLVDQEVVPQLKSLDTVANITISGGQLLPGEGGSVALPVSEVNAEAASLLLQLSPEVWDVVAAKGGNIGDLNEQAVETLRDGEFTVPANAPALPESWQMDRFVNATDLLEVRTLTQSIAGILDNFREHGRIVGALGQTDDLTPEDVKRMLEIEPSLVEYFEAEHLVAMSPEVFAILPDDFIANLDGFTRDALAAAALAETVTGETATRTSVNLPSAWRIQPPQIITFSFADLPLASFSVSSTASPSDVVASNTEENNTDSSEGTNPSTDTSNEGNNTTNLPEGPELPAIFALVGELSGMELELDTADDLINIELPEAMATQFGVQSLSAAQFLGFLAQFDPTALAAQGGEGGTAPNLQDLDVTQILPALTECGLGITDMLGGNFDTKAIIRCISADAIAYLIANDPTFLANLSSDVYDAFSDEVLSLPEIAPPLSTVWNTLADQPQFDQKPLRTAQDLLALGDGKASTILNNINETVPERFAGYEVRLFDSLTPGVVRYLALNEPDFYENLDIGVLEKLSPQALALLPQEVLEGLADATADKLVAVAAGEQNSAAQEIQALYATDVSPADPSAPALSSDWQFVANFIGIELNNAYDLFRFSEQVGTPAQFINGFFDSPGGASFAPRLLGSLTPEAFNYIAERDANFINDLSADSLLLLPDNIKSTLPAEVIARTQSSSEPFRPTDLITRANGNSSLLITVYKTREANTVQSYHTVEGVLREIDASDDTIEVNVAFEQASFIEESISGVAREGGLGAVFAVVVILVFLSGGVWSRSPRRVAGVILVVVFAALLGLVVFSGIDAAGGDVGLAFDQTDVVVRVLLMLGIVAGFGVMLWPGNLPNPAWRSTLVTAVSIPLSVLMALALMKWFSPAMHNLIAPLADDSPFFTFVLRLFPLEVTLNIMTLSGLTVAIGRVVDDSIVVLENIFRQMQAGGDKREAIITGTRDVSVAIFAATVVTVVVFLPLGLTGGIIGAFFLPFGLAVTYALASSFIVAVTVIPVLVYLLVKKEDLPEEHDGRLAEVYQSTLRRVLSLDPKLRIVPFLGNRTLVLLLAFVSLVIGGALFAGRPTTFLPELGEPQIAVSVNLPSSTKILETNAKVAELETFLRDEIPAEDISTVRTTVGGGGQSLETLIGGSASVSENRAEITIGMESQSNLDAITQEIREKAEAIFGVDNVTVSAQSMTGGGFGGFAVVVSGKQEDLVAINDQIIETLSNVPGLTNVSSNLSAVGGVGSSDGPTTYLRVDLQPAVSYSAELETEDTLGTTQKAIEAVKSLPNLPDVQVSQGFQSELQTQGFASLIQAMGIAILMVVVILIITFGSLVHWLDIILSVVVAPVGAAVALTLTNRTLGISALIGMLMLIGIVVTNAVVLIDRVQANRRERGMDVYNALVEAGGRRLRPILMTALATIMALIPLAIGLSKGAIIASELGTVVIGGLFSSTLLTLIVVPVAYSLLAPLHKLLVRLVGRGGAVK